MKLQTTNSQTRVHVYGTLLKIWMVRNIKQLRELVVRCLIELDGRGHLKLYLSSLEEEICMNIEVVGHPALTTPLKNFQKKSKENRHLKIWIIRSKEFIQKEAF